MTEHGFGGKYFSHLGANERFVGSLEVAGTVFLAKVRDGSKRSAAFVNTETRKMPSILGGPLGSILGSTLELTGKTLRGLGRTLNVSSPRKRESLETHGKPDA